MGFKNFKVNVLVRLAGIVGCSLIAFSVLETNVIFLTPLLFFFLVIIQAVSLLKYLDKSNQEIVSFLKSIKHDDLDSTLSTNNPNKTLNNLNKEFNKVIKRFRSIRKGKEAEYQYLKNIVQHVGIGLLTFNKENGKIQIINTAAKKLLQINKAENIKEFKSISDQLVDSFFRLKTGGRELLKLQVGGELIQLAVYAIELTLGGNEYKLVSLQNIHSELEEKEMEAWQNLVRVLTHEIMNSITPIQSLAATVEGELKEQFKNPAKISAEDIEDIELAVKTIQKRSQGLIRFVQDFRNLTRTPKPKLKKITVSELLKQIEVLMKNEVANNKVDLSVSTDPSDLTINADKELVEQVLINLVKNAIQAFDEQTHRHVQLKAYVTDKGRPIISVADNGNGIDEEALQRIFIPFYTTKKNGSGIGLSLSRQIMRQHQGMLTVKSEIDEGTEFSLRF